MKKFYLLSVILLIFAIGYSQTYKPMLKENKTWETGYYIPFQSIPTTDYYIFYLNGDTLVDGNHYYKLFGRDTVIAGNPLPLTYPSISQFTGKLIREDTLTKQIFGRTLGDTSELIIYDFSVNVGDTMRSVQWGMTSGPPPYSHAIVDSIKPYVLNNGETSKIYYVNPLDFGVLTFPFFVIEGVGGCNGFYYPFQGVFEDGANLTCVKDNGVELYSNGICGTILSIYDNEFVETALNIFPNPTNGNELFISGENISTIEILNLQGQLIKTIEASTNEVLINIANQAKGIYFVKAQFNDGTIVIKKLIVNPLGVIK